MLASPISSNVPEARRDLRISDADWLDLLYPWLDQQSGWWLEFRFAEDRSDDLKNPPVALRFLRDAQEISAHLRAHRALAASRAEELRRSQSGPWPAGLFWGVQPRVTRRSGRERVAAMVALTVTLVAEDWAGWPARDRPRVMWEALHGCPQPPSVVTWTGDGFEVWWLLREPLFNRKRGEEVQQAIAGCFHAARSADAAGLCRWPDTLNYRRLPQGRASRVRVVWWQPETRWRIEALAERFRAGVPPSRGARTREPGAVWRRFDRLLEEHEPLREFWSSHSGPATACDRHTLNAALATLLAGYGLDRAEFATVAALARWNLEPVPEPGELGRVYDELTPAERPEPAAVPPAPESVAPHILPQTAWTEWARLYRYAVGSSTEAADEFHYL
ncbi:MAG: hypothetical protein AB1758_27330, partial [Candidatus Eremiobacterota bacterium]